MALSACSRSAEVRYKVTVGVEEDGELRTGSSIWVWRIRRPTIALASTYETEFRGEAVVIPLVRHPTVFALLVSADADANYSPLLVERTFGHGFANLKRTGRSYDRVAEARDIASRVGERADLDCGNPDACPMFVWFDDQADPTSLRRADPATYPEMVGHSVRLRAVTLEITRDEPVRSIEQRLPWLRSVAEGRSTIIPRRVVRPGDGTKKPVLSPLQKVGTRSFSTDLFL